MEANSSEKCDSKTCGCVLRAVCRGFYSECEFESSHARHYDPAGKLSCYHWLDMSFRSLCRITTPDYRWMFNGINLTNGTHISGATSATLTVSNVTSADNGMYRVSVSNFHGAVLRFCAVITVVFANTAQRWINQWLGAIRQVFRPRFPAICCCWWQKDGVSLTDGNGITDSTTTLMAAARPEQCRAISVGCDQRLSFRNHE